MTRLLCSIAAMILICHYVHAELPSITSTIEQRVDNFIAELPDEFNGTILLALGDSIIMNKGYGYANRAYDIPNSDRTSYQIASMTKTLTAVLTIMLMGEGCLDIHATIDEYFPSYPKEKASRITINHLLHNTSGIKQHFNAIKDYFRGRDMMYHTPREYIDVFADEPLAHDPGDGHTYSTLNYWLLGVILEHVTGRTYAELVRDYIFVPLGMDDTFVENNLTLHKNVAYGYKMGLSGYVRDRTEEPSIIVASGDIVSTTADLFKFNRAMTQGSSILLPHSGKALLPLSQATFLADACSNSESDTLTIIGLGTGSNYGFRSRMTSLVELDACYIVLSNVHKDRAMGQKMYRFLEDQLLYESGMCRVSENPSWDSMLVSKPIEVDPVFLQAYEGTYQLSGTGKRGFIIVSLINDVLHYQMYYDVWGAVYVAAGRLKPLSKDENGAEFLSDDGNDVYARIYYLPPKEAITDSILVAKDRQFVGLGHRTVDSATFDMAEYCGDYTSIELQEVLSIDCPDGQPILRNFRGSDSTVLIPVAEDIFGCVQGFLVFERYPDGAIRHFRYRAEDVDNYLFGSLCIRRL